MSDLQHAAASNCNRCTLHTNPPLAHCGYQGGLQLCRHTTTRHHICATNWAMARLRHTKLASPNTTLGNYFNAGLHHFCPAVYGCSANTKAAAWTRSCMAFFQRRRHARPTGCWCHWRSPSPQRSGTTCTQCQVAQATVGLENVAAEQLCSVCCGYCVNMLLQSNCHCLLG